MSPATAIAVARNATHHISKPQCGEITLVAGLGVEGDAHFGKTVQHRSRIAKTPNAPNLRQVHLLHAELFDNLSVKGFDISPGQVGENVTTQGVDLLNLPRGTKLAIGAKAVIEITGLRNPCNQLNGIARGLMEAVLDRDEEGELMRLCGVMGVVKSGGTVRAGDVITLDLPNMPHERLMPV